MDRQLLITDAIVKANANISNLSEEALNVQGFTGYKVKHLLNNIGAFSSVCGEVGTHKGSYTVATNYGNKLEYWVCDNWSQFEQGGLSKKMFFDYMQSFNLHPTVYEQDCFTLKLPDSLKGKMDLYIFDGEHSYESQRKALTHYYDHLSDEFIYIVDDFSWEDVKKGTYDGIKDGNYQILAEWFLWNDVQSDGGNWWNGIGVFLLKK